MPPQPTTVLAVMSQEVGAHGVRGPPHYSDRLLDSTLVPPEVPSRAGFSYLSCMPDRFPIPERDDALLAQCRVDTFRAGGPGGQHQNTTESAVRLVHEPTGIQVTARDERSQHRNKALALARLREALEKRNRPRKKRVRTRVPRREKRKRLENKRRRSDKKRLRKPPKRDS